MSDITITVMETVSQAAKYEPKTYTLSELREIWPAGDETVASRLIDSVEQLSDRVAELEKENARLRGALIEIKSICKCSYEHDEASEWLRL